MTSIFPGGARVGEPVTIEMNGWNLQEAKLAPPPKTAKPGVHLIAANKKGVVSNYLPFALGTLPECFDKESNNDQPHAQKVKLPIVVNGRMDRPDDWDVFGVEGRAGDTIVAEVTARRLDSPMDSMLKLTDAAGKLLALNDDHADPESGLNTHHAEGAVLRRVSMYVRRQVPFSRGFVNCWIFGRMLQPPNNSRRPACAVASSYPPSTYSVGSWQS